MQTTTHAPRTKPLGIFSLAMINIIAVDSLRSLPAGAEYGLSLVFFYLVAALCFFIPTALVTAELATAWPTTGGVYIWVRTAFGARWGLFTIWLQWIYNVIWYPTILAFIASTLAYLIAPSLASSKFYTLGVILVTLWVVTGLNCLGLRVASWFTSLGAIIGTLIPMLLITGLGAAWLYAQHPTEIQFTWAALTPHLHDYHTLAFLSTLMFGLMGLEMSSVHAGDVGNPQRDYPRALLLSASLILASLILASLAIAVVIPPAKLSILSGLTDAYVLFFNSYGLHAFIPLIIIMIILGTCCCISAWLLGPSRGLLIAARESGLSSRWLQLNAQGMPNRLLLLQALVVTALSGVFILMPSVNSAYWLLSVMTMQLAIGFYIFMFAAALRLRYKHSAVTQTFRIPGGQLGIWFVTLLGIASCLFTFAIGFIPPPDMQIGSLLKFESLLIGGIVLFCLPPLLLRRNKITNTQS